MVSVAVVAGGGYDQALFKKSLAMDALRIIAQDVMFWNVVDPGNWRSFTVTLSTENRDVHLVGAGSNVTRRENVVFAVAFATGWGIGSTAFQSTAMNSGIKIFIGLIVADSAVDFFQRFRMGEILHIRILMAIDAI